MDPLNNYLELSQKVSYGDLDQKTVNATKDLLLDLFGAMIGGTSTRAAQQTAALAARWGGPPEATVLAGGYRVPLHTAVLANCTAGRALDYDDVHEQAHLHATVAVVPPALALGEMHPVSGRDFITAVVLGFEMMARMGLSLKEGPGKTGLSTTYQGASMAAAYVGAKLLGLEEEVTGNAVGIAYSQMAGNQQVIREGVDMMVIQQGLSGMNGMIALEMARAGINGPQEVFCGRYGYFPVYHPERYKIEAFTEGLGEKWEIANTSIKPYSCCKLIHTALQACLELREERKIDPSNVKAVRVGINREDFDMVCEPLEVKRKPRTTVDAVFSVPYVLSCGLLEGKVTLNDFTAEAIKRPEVTSFAHIIQPVRDHELPKNTANGIPAWVEITLNDGSELRRYQDAVPGSPSMPMEKEGRLAKFFDCIDFSGHPREKANRLLEMLENLEQLNKIDSLVELCVK